MQDDMEDFEAYGSDEPGSSGADESDADEEDGTDSEDDKEQGGRAQQAKRAAAGRSSKAKRRRPMNIEYEMEHEMEPMRATQSMQH